MLHYHLNKHGNVTNLELVAAIETLCIFLLAAGNIAAAGESFAPTHMLNELYNVAKCDWNSRTKVKKSSHVHQDSLVWTGYLFLFIYF